MIATELKNNSMKLAKWTTASLLAGVDQMRIGFVSRVAPRNNVEHALLAAQRFIPKSFAAQLSLDVNNMWGIMKVRGGEGGRVRCIIVVITVAAGGGARSG